MKAELAFQLARLIYNLLAPIFHWALMTHMDFCERYKGGHMLEPGDDGWDWCQRCGNGFSSRADAVEAAIPQAKAHQT